MNDNIKLQIPIEDIEELAAELSRKLYDAVSTFNMSDAYEVFEELRELVEASDLPEEELGEFIDIVDEVQEAFDDIEAILGRLSH
jgi:Cdc6-like AAA superfamily ATPase